MSGLKKYLPQVELELRSQLDYLSRIQFPELKAIDNFDVNHEIFTKMPREIKENFDLPSEDDQVIYMMTLSGVPTDAAYRLAIKAEIERVKSDFSHERSQITTINNTNFNYHIENATPELPVYIGTSSNFPSRLKTHVGHGSKGTATVYLKGWPLFKEHKELRFSFKYFNFGTEVAPETLKYFEYYFSQELRPIIGHNRRS
jgi:hypothetical protein